MHQLYKLINRILITLSTHFKFKLIIFAIIFYVFYFLHQTINNDFITVIRCQLAHSKAERIRSKLQIYNNGLGSSSAKYEINTREFEDSPGDAGWMEIYIMLGRS